LKSKVLVPILISILFLWIFSYFLFDLSRAGDDFYEISIIEKNYDIFKIREINDRKCIHFNISITLYNSGNIESDDITVKIVDEDGGYVRNGTLMPNESKTFIFDDHPLLDMSEHRINISFYPTNKNVGLTDYNHGESVLILLTGDKEDDGFTPGFEVILLVTTIVVYVFLTRYKN